MEACEAMGLINRLLDAGHEVRIRTDWKNHGTIITSDDAVVETLERIILWPGYLNCTRAGTPARIDHLKKGGGFCREDLRDVEEWSPEMVNTYNEHDRENWYDEDEGGEDDWLDGSYEQS